MESFDLGWFGVFGTGVEIGELWLFRCSVFGDWVEDEIRTSSSHSLTLHSLFLMGLVGCNGNIKGTPWVEWHSSSSELKVGV